MYNFPYKNKGLGLWMWRKSTRCIGMDTWWLHYLSLVNSCSCVLISPYILICISPLPNEVKYLSDGDLPSEGPLWENSFSISQVNWLFTYCWGFRVGSHTGHGPLVVKVVWVWFQHCSSVSLSLLEEYFLMWMKSDLFLWILYTLPSLRCQRFSAKVCLLKFNGFKSLFFSTEMLLSIFLKSVSVSSLSVALTYASATASAAGK